MLELFILVISRNFRYYKNRFKLKNSVQIHHIIPRQYKSHPVILTSGYSIEENSNLMMLPSAPNRNTSRLVHNGGHAKYNEYIQTKLDTFSSVDEILTLKNTLKQYIRKGDQSLPWK
tara:strand:- start:11068 stop:11418 length:351 start_codon:yes stop_codon:yes gene_type:complete